MPISDPRDRFFYPHHTPMKDTYSLAHGLRQLARDTMCDASYLQTLLTHRNEKFRMTFGVGHCTTLIVNILFKTLIFPIIGKKNNQSSVSDAERKIPTLGSTDNASNSVNIVSGIIRLPSGGISRFASETDDRFYLSQPAGPFQNWGLPLSVRLSVCMSVCPSVRHALRYRVCVINSSHSFKWVFLKPCIPDVDILKMCMWAFGGARINLDRITAFRTWSI